MEHYCRERQTSFLPHALEKIRGVSVIMMQIQSIFFWRVQTMLTAHADAWAPSPEDIVWGVNSPASYVFPNHSPQYIHGYDMSATCVADTMCQPRGIDHGENVDLDGKPR